jgi:serine/threonine protein kinase
MAKPPSEPHQRQHHTTTAGPLAVPPGTLLIGTYEILEHLNTGGMGEVYRGVNIHNEEVVAIKIVLPALAHDEKILSLFQKESTVLRRIAHDAIVRYEVFTRDPVLDRPCLIMEYAAGPSLGDRMEHGPLSLPEVLVLLQRLTAGLDVAHRGGVVHRDLSPDNVILCGNDVAQAKIIDFGIAKASTPGGRTLIGGQFAGKPGYVAPEQLGLYDGHVTGQADIYSMGLLAVAAALGYPLDMGDTPAAAVMARIKVPDLSGVDPELVPLLEWMLQPDPANRPATMAEISAWISAHFSDVLPAPAAAASTYAPQTMPPRSPVPARSTQAPSSGVATSAPPVSGGASIPPQPARGPNRAPYQPTVLADRPPVSTPPQRSDAPVVRQTTLPPTSLGGRAQPAVESPAPQLSVPPAPAPDQSASPFGPGPEQSDTQPNFGRRASDTAATPKSGGLPVLPIVAVAVLALAGGGVWMSGLLSSEPVAPQIAAAPAPAAVVPATPVEPAPVEPAPVAEVATAPAPAPDPTPEPEIAALDPQDWLDARIASGLSEPCAWLPRDSKVTGSTAFAAQPAAFDALQVDFAAEFGRDLPLILHPLAAAQCYAFHILTQVEQRGTPSERLGIVAPAELVAGDTAELALRVTGQPRDTLSVLVIDPAGRVQNISEMVTNGEVRLAGRRIAPPLEEVARGRAGPVFAVLVLDTVQPLSILGALPANAILPTSNAQEFWQFLERDLQALPVPPDFTYATISWRD